MARTNGKGSEDRTQKETGYPHKIRFLSERFPALALPRCCFCVMVVGHASNLVWPSLRLRMLGR